MPDNKLEKLAKLQREEQLKLMQEAVKSERRFFDSPAQEDYQVTDSGQPRGRVI